VTWLLPELEDGEEPELRPLELELELDPVEVEPELVEPELLELEPELVEPELLEPELVEPELLEPDLAAPEEVDALAVCVDPGRTRATAPAATTLATVTAAVADLTLPRPRSLAAMAWWIPSRSLLVM
jgi:hypothetical protein